MFFFGSLYKVNIFMMKRIWTNKKKQQRTLIKRVRLYLESKKNKVISDRYFFNRYFLSDTLLYPMIHAYKTVMEV